MSYKVGQTLYIIHHKKQTVAPIQVVEQILRRTLSGEETTYIVQVPIGKGELKKVPLEELDGELYEDITVVHKALMDNVKNVVDELVERAQATAKKYFTEPEAPVLIPSPDAEEMQVALEDGTLANIKMPGDML